MNVRPKNYTWPEFYDGLIDVTRYSFSWRAIARRVPATADGDPQVDERGAGDVVRGLGTDPVPHHDPAAARHRPRRCGPIWKGRPTVLPAFYLDRIRQELGPMFEHLPGRRAVRTIPTPISPRPADEPAPVPLRSRRAG